MNRYKLTLMNDCTYLETVKGVHYFEHPTLGDESTVLAVYNGIMFDSGFYDPFNETDTEYVKENYEEAKDLTTEITEWEEYME